MIVTVLRSGGIYTAEWVQKLDRATGGVVCLTDMDVPGVVTIPLLYDFPGWWAKMELFRPGVFGGAVLYMDLDTLPVGDLDDMHGYRGDFAMISDFYRPSRAQSGVMAWTPGLQSDAAWDAFSRNPEGAMSRYRGDGEFLADHVNAVRLQDIFPGQIVSLKAHAAQGPTEGARLVCGHGDPRFTSPAAGWAHTHWMAA